MAMVMGNDPDESDDQVGPRAPDPAVPLVLPPRPGGRANGSVVMAAMLGIGEALGLDQEQAEVVEASAQTDQPLDLDFGDLPPLT